jgi:hypothetical protein
MIVTISIVPRWGRKWFALGFTEYQSNQKFIVDTSDGLAHDIGITRVTFRDTVLGCAGSGSFSSTVIDTVIGSTSPTAVESHVSCHIVPSK